VINPKEFKKLETDTNKFFYWKNICFYSEANRKNYKYNILEKNIALQLTKRLFY